MMAGGAETGAYARAGRVLHGINAASGAVGGLLMVAAMLALVFHVIGNVFGAPILGGSEIVVSLIGPAIFCFLGPCHLQGANIVVDYFSKPLPLAARNLLDVVAAVLFAAVATLLTWRLILGGISAYTRSKQSMFLGIPEWPSYLVAAIACAVWVVTIYHSVWTAIRVLRGEAAPGSEPNLHG